MPASARVGTASSSPRTGSSRRSSKASSSDAQQYQYNKREKAKSSQSYVQPLRRESVSQAASNAGSAQRPSLKSRANSAPLVPRGQLQSLDDVDVEDSLGGEAEDILDDEEIAEDPFFQRYNFASTEDMGTGEQSSSSADSSSDTEGALSPTHSKPRPDSLAEPLSSPLSPVYGPRNEPQPQATEEKTMYDINICVLGAAGVGKSTFVSRAFELPSLPTSCIATSRMSIDGTTHIVRLLELPFNEVDIDDDYRISWPTTLDGMTMPRVDGVFTLYDVTNKESLAQVPDILNALHKVSLPFVLVSTKCDSHPAHQAIDPSFVEQRAKNLLALSEISAFRSAETAPETQNKCLTAILRMIVSSRQDFSGGPPARRRANSSVARGRMSPRSSYLKKHERASSEYSGTKLKAITPGPYDKKKKQSEFSSSSKSKHKSSTPQESFLDLEESPGYDSPESEAPSSPDEEAMSIVSEPTDAKGYTFDQLVDRLLAQPLSKADSKFAAIFLALYRRFATPGQLLDAIIKRFDAQDKDKNPAMIKTVNQLRHLAIMEQWLSCYPGDFAYPTTRKKMNLFVSRLSGNRIYSVAARELFAELEVVVEDDDTEWACSDKYREKDQPPKSFLSGYPEESSGDEDMVKSLDSLTIISDQTPVLSPTTRSASGSTSSSSQTMLNTVENAQRQAKLLVPIPRVPLSKLQWHLLMGETDEGIARELTRMDWIMFSSIRPRDLVRHVSLNAEQKKKCKGLENVNRLIDHFNHLAYWVANFILLRDKPKHRALMLEKFMKVARKLREMNNYNSLGAVLAGINGTAVHRLQSTRELITPATAKDFMKLEILMSTQKSHFAYRLAWENSSGERIPYLPLHRRDLVSAAEGNSTFIASNRPSVGLESRPGAGLPTTLLSRSVGSAEAPPGGVTGKERLNWRKFEIMGEVIVGVQRAQGTPYPPLTRNDEVRGLIFDTRIVKDEDVSFRVEWIVCHGVGKGKVRLMLCDWQDLYERSVLVEPGPNQGGDGRRRFGWFKGGLGTGMGISSGPRGATGE